MPMLHVIEVTFLRQGGALCHVERRLYAEAAGEEQCSHRNGEEVIVKA